MRVRLPGQLLRRRPHCHRRRSLHPRRRRPSPRRRRPRRRLLRAQSPSSLAAGVVCLALTATAAALAWPAGSPLVPRNSGHPGGDRAWAWWFLALLVGAFVVYVVGVALVRASAPRVVVIGAVAAAIQLAPLGAPLLLSTDAWTYWDYGRLASVHGLNPYRADPEQARGDPAFRYVGAAWRDTTSVYGPAFTLASEPLARAAGTSAD